MGNQQGKVSKTCQVYTAKWPNMYNRYCQVGLIGASVVHTCRPIDERGLHNRQM